MTGTKSTPSQTGRSSTGPTRSHPSDNVTPDVDDKRDNLSNQVGSDVREEVPSEQTQEPNPTPDEPFRKKINSRQKWTIEEKRDLYKCYCKAIIKKMRTTEGTYTIWREENLTNRTNMNAVTLNNQRRVVEKWLTQSEKEQIMNEATREEQNVIEEMQNNVLPKAPDRTPKDNDDTNNTNTNDMEIELNEEEIKMKNELTVMYHRIKEEDINTAKRPKNYPMNKTNKKNLTIMNKILTQLISNELREIGLHDLNALHYSAAVTLAGTQEISKPNKQQQNDPDIRIKKQIENIRKWIGRLTMANRNGTKNKQKIEKILKGNSITKTLQKYKMKLAAVTKRLRTRKANPKRQLNNKL